MAPARPVGRRLLRRPLSTDETGLHRTNCAGKVSVDIAGLLCARPAFRVSTLSVEVPALRFRPLSPVNDRSHGNRQQNPADNCTSVHRCDTPFCRFLSGSETIAQSARRRQGTDWAMTRRAPRGPARGCRTGKALPRPKARNAALQSGARIDRNMKKARRLSAPGGSIQHSSSCGQPEKPAMGAQGPDWEKGRSRKRNSPCSKTRTS